MSSNEKIAFGVMAIGALILAASSGSEEEDQATVGWAPAEDEDFASLYEKLLLDRRPIDVSKFESGDRRPTCGAFHQVRRKEIFLGTTPKSITYVALRSTAKSVSLENGYAEREASKFADSISRSSFHRLAFFHLIVCSSWNDEIYGTYGYRTNTPAGPHGRGIDLRPVHAPNRQRISDGQAPLRVIPLCLPEQRGSGIASEGAGEYPYLWIPPLNGTALLRGEVTTRGLRWEDETSQINPPPEVLRLGKAIV
jgi:hypothetical protein